MRTLPSPVSALALSLAAAAGALGVATSAPQDTRRPPFGEQPEAERRRPLREREQLRMQAEIEGTWLLMGYRTPDVRADDSLFRGWAMFHEGYASWVVYGTIEGQGLFGLRDDASLEALLMRYRVGPDLTLQLATMRGFDNLNDDGELRFDDGRTALEYEMRLEDGLLTLRLKGHETFEFRKLARTELPEKALRALELGGDADIFDEDD